ncbi:MAG TPA: type I restriction endonuclease subunit R [Thermomicrobiales bacterium]|nr:type I restriction endonuclease subunit R [Thermomicrobiales bacterium]
MPLTKFTESIVEEAALAWLADLGYEVVFGPDIAPGEPTAERADYREVVLAGRLRAALARLNPGAAPDALAEAFRQITQAGGPSLVRANQAFHRWLTEGIEVELLRDGEPRGEHVRLGDFADPAANDWLAVNQYTVVEGRRERRPDVVVFVNGLPLAVIELKNAADEQATIWKAWQQLQTYQQQLPRLFTYNALQVISDGVEARLGTLHTPKERFLPWKTITGDELEPPTANQLEVLLKGVFEPARFLDLIRGFVVFEDDGATVEKKVAAYHQFHAVRRAVATTLRAAAPEGSRRGGVVWHTQGSGKSLTMVFFAGKLVVHPALANPTLVVLTDRTDLDDQLCGVFARCAQLLRQTPVQAADRADLRTLLAVPSGGVVFTTVQKFLPDEKGDTYPTLSERRNVVVIADEAHRSQYDFIDGYARHIHDALPNATFVGFTGTPLELADRDTRLVFGDYIDVYDVQRAVEDGATVPIYYESRLAKIDLPDAERPRLDEGFEEVTEREEVAQKEKLKSKWAQLEALVGANKRLAQVAADLVAHFEGRQDAIAGKGLIVCMSRRICVDLYDELVALRPAWHSDDDARGALKVVMTGSASDPLAWQPHIRNKPRRDDLAQRFKDPDDPLQLVIVRDMWLTGFDVPPLHTMYLDKPMRGHSLMQAIARVNRVFRDKPGGLVVDYLGLANNLRQALATYAQSGGHGHAAVDQDEAVAELLRHLDVCRSFFFGFDYSHFLAGSPTERLAVLPAAQEFLLLQDLREPGTRQRFLDAALALAKSFALAVPRPEALAIRDELIFFQTVKAAIAKATPRGPGRQGDLDHAIRQLVEAAIAPGGVVDIFAAAGLKKPDISVLSDAFLAEVRDLPQKNLAVELLQKLVNDEIVARGRKNVVESRAFSEKLSAALTRYHNRAIETARVIEELIDIARELAAARDRGARLGLGEDELAFYDALEVNDSAVQVLGDPVLHAIARELAETVRRGATIDWAVRETARANLRRLVRRVLRRHGYPPDQQERATQTVIQQAELLSSAAANDSVE